MPPAEFNWTEILSGHGGENVIALGLFSIFGIIGVTVIVAAFWHKARLVRLKEQMIERGYSAQEIVAVVSAGEDFGRSKAGLPISNTPANASQASKAAAN
jgi:hypothetical protein